jgi:hypothetical protein
MVEPCRYCSRKKEKKIIKSSQRDCQQLLESIEKQWTVKLEVRASDMIFPTFLNWAFEFRV